MRSLEKKEIYDFTGNKRKQTINVHYFIVYFWTNNTKVHLSRKPPNSYTHHPDLNNVHKEFYFVCVDVNNMLVGHFGLE